MEIISSKPEKGTEKRETIEGKKGIIWAKIRFILIERLGLPGRFIARIITMVWLRYLYVIGPKLKINLSINEFHSLFSLEPKIDAFVFSHISSANRFFGDSTTYEKLLASLRKYTNDKDLGMVDNIKPRAGFFIRITAFIAALYPFKPKMTLFSV